MQISTQSPNGKRSPIDTLGHILGFETPDNDLESDLAELKSEHDLFASDGSAEDAGFVRSLGRDIQSWLGIADADAHGSSHPMARDDESADDFTTAQLDHCHVAFGEAATGNVLDHDFDTKSTPPLVALAVGPANGTVSLKENGAFRYEPDANFFGLDRFWYKVVDENGTTEQVEVCIFVDAPPNLVPNAEDDSYSTGYGEPITGQLIGGQLIGQPADNESTSDNGEAIAKLLEEPENGRVTLKTNGTFEYTPNEGFSGTDSFVYRGADSKNGGPIAIVSIHVAEPVIEEVTRSSSGS